MRPSTKTECQLIVDGHIINWKWEEILCPYGWACWTGDPDWDPSRSLSGRWFCWVIVANVNPSAVTSDPILSKSGWRGSSDDSGVPEIKMNLHFSRAVNISSARKIVASRSSLVLFLALLGMTMVTGTGGVFSETLTSADLICTDRYWPETFSALVRWDVRLLQYSCSGYSGVTA